MKIHPNILFEIMFSPGALLKTFFQRHSATRARGLDRLNGGSFAKIAADELGAASRKCLAGHYSFTPFLEHLRIKDRSSAPRLISIPTVRDRVVLSQLNSYLKLLLPKETKLKLASDYIREISKNLKSADPITTWTAGLDIKKFYDSLDRTRLKVRIAQKMPEHRATKLISAAIETSTVPKNYRRRDYGLYRSEAGIPQGLAISNSLAAIYMYDVDTAMKDLGVEYYRYVDDVLVVGTKELTAKAARSFSARARARRLSVHGTSSTKGHHRPLHQRFSYLGYDFHMPVVSVRSSTIERLIQGLAAKISEYKYGKEKILLRKPYLTEDTLRDAFIDELNERISGAISENKRYGWISYFSQITDESILHQIDAALHDMLSRNASLSAYASSVKRFARAFFEIRFRPNDGYVRNYDQFKTAVQKLKFLVFRGQIDGASALTEQQINDRFEAYRDKQLSSMIADEAGIY